MISNKINITFYFYFILMITWDLHIVQKIIVFVNFKHLQIAISYVEYDINLFTCSSSVALVPMIIIFFILT